MQLYIVVKVTNSSKKAPPFAMPESLARATRKFCTGARRLPSPQPTASQLAQNKSAPNSPLKPLQKPLCIALPGSRISSGRHRCCRHLCLCLCECLCGWCRCRRLGGHLTAARKRRTPVREARQRARRTRGRLSWDRSGERRASSREMK